VPLLLAFAASCSQPYDGPMIDAVVEQVTGVNVHLCLHGGERVEVLLDVDNGHFDLKHLRLHAAQSAPVSVGISKDVIRAISDSENWPDGC